MTFDEFIKREKERVTRFESFWRRHAKENSVEWPMNLGEADWMEQFDWFVNTHGDNDDVR